LVMKSRRKELMAMSSWVGREAGAKTTYSSGKRKDSGAISH
jgi:hypothetical protein